MSTFFSDLMFQPFLFTVNRLYEIGFSVPNPVMRVEQIDSTGPSAHQIPGIIKGPKHLVAVQQYSEPSKHKLRETMSWMQGPIDPPPLHPNLEEPKHSIVRTMPFQFNSGHLVIKETTRLYRSIGSR